MYSTRFSFSFNNWYLGSPDSPLYIGCSIRRATGPILFSTHWKMWWKALSLFPNDHQIIAKSASNTNFGSSTCRCSILRIHSNAFSVSPNWAKAQPKGVSPFKGCFVNRWIIRRVALLISITEKTNKDRLIVVWIEFKF